MRTRTGLPSWARCVRRECSAWSARPTRPLQIPGSLLIQAARAVSGSNTGSPLALAEMLDVAARHNVKTQTERFPMTKVNEAVAKVRKGTVRYRAVLAN